MQIDSNIEKVKEMMAKEERANVLFKPVEIVCQVLWEVSHNTLTKSIYSI